MTPWPKIMGFGLDDWIYWHLLYNLYKHIQLPKLTINLQPVLPSLSRTRSIVVLVLRMTSDLRLNYYVVSRRIHRKHIRCPVMDIYANHIENTASPIGVKNACLLTRYLAMDICAPRRQHLFCCQECVFFGQLPSNGSTCHNIFNVLPEFIFGWEIRTQLHRAFFP
jgi:hypothetical protein